MWTTRTTVVTPETIGFPPTNQALQSFNVKGRKFLWDRAFVSDAGKGDYY